MYQITPDVLKGATIVTALQDYPNMPGMSDLFTELDYLNECLLESEKFYGVAFKRSNNNDDIKRPKDQFDVISDVKGHFEEFYFGGNQTVDFGFRPRAYYRLVVEPLLDSMAHLSHDDVLDATTAVIDQIKDRMLISERQQPMDSSTAYKQYQSMATARQNDKKVKVATAGVMKLRNKTLALAKEMSRSK